MPVLTFDPGPHRYALDGVHVPGVTDLLKAALNFAQVPPEVLAAACERGTTVHRVVELDAQGRLDEDTVDDRVRGHFAQWRLFRRQTGFQVIATEARVHSARFGFAGTLDLLGRFPGDPPNVYALPDLKTCALAPATVGPQSAAYETAARECGLVPLTARVRRFSLRLNPSLPSYRLDPLTDGRDWAVFSSIVTLWRFLREHGIA